MTAVAFVDTNLLVCCYDRSNLFQQERADAVLDALASAGVGALSTQVLGEFLVNVTCKPAVPLPLDDALEEVRRYLRSWIVLDVTSRVVEEAVRGVRAYRMNYWDAQIWAVAYLNRIPFVLSEDFSDGAVLDGVRFVNPLDPDFRLEQWLDPRDRKRR